MGMCAGAGRGRASHIAHADWNWSSVPARATREGGELGLAVCGTGSVGGGGGCRPHALPCSTLTARAVSPGPNSAAPECGAGRCKSAAGARFAPWYGLNSSRRHAPESLAAARPRTHPAPCLAASDAIPRLLTPPQSTPTLPVRARESELLGSLAARDGTWSTVGLALRHGRQRGKPTQRCARSLACEQMRGARQSAQLASAGMPGTYAPQARVHAYATRRSEALHGKSPTHPNPLLMVSETRDRVSCTEGDRPTTRFSRMFRVEFDLSAFGVSAHWKQVFAFQERINSCVSHCAAEVQLRSGSLPLWEPAPHPWTMFVP